MNKKEAIEFLEKSLEETSRLKRLHYDDKDFELWISKIKNVIKAGLDQDDYKTFDSAYSIAIPMKGIQTEKRWLEFYQANITQRETGIKKIIQKYETLGIEEKPAIMAGQPPKAFIAHGGDSPALRNLKSFLEALGVQPLVVEEQPSEGRSIAENVDHYARQANCAIILATKGDIDGKTDGFIPRGNVLMEIGKLQEIFKDKIIYLLQAGVKFPTNVSGKVRERFTSKNMERAFIKIARELTKWGFITARATSEHSSEDDEAPVRRLV